ncbi:tRNA pseudouridine(38-40) synthase TruA [Bacteroidota bacterium]
MAVTKIALILEYEGTKYCGFQLQAELPTIQSELEAALWKLTGERIRIIGASRTDSGVHARGQVVSFRTKSLLPQATFVKGLNHYLLKDIAVKAAHKIADSFDVRRDAVSREYKYYILNSRIRSPLRQGFCYQVAGELNLEIMNTACQALVGKQDLASFASELGDNIKNTIRTVHQAEMQKNNDMAIFYIVANSFLPHQVRNTIGALIRVGSGKMTVSDFHSIIKSRQPGLAGPTAPACGLFLLRVNYPRPLGEEA